MKAWKIFLSIGITILLIGIIVLIIGLALNGWKMTVEYEMQTYNAQQENSTLDLDLSAGEMNVEFYDGDNIEVTYPDSFQYGYTVKESGGTLSVSPKKNYFIWFGWNKIPTVTVKIPNGRVLDMKIDVSAGVVKVADGEYGNMRIRLSAGLVSLGDTVCKDFRASLSAGKLDVGKVDCTSCDVHLSAGTASLEKVTCDKIKVDLSAGSANLTVAGKQSDYTVMVDKSAGSCNLSNQLGTVSGKLIDIDLSAGSVDVKFTD